MIIVIRNCARAESSFFHRKHRSRKTRYRQTSENFSLQIYKKPFSPCHRAIAFFY